VSTRFEARSQLRSEAGISSSDVTWSKRGVVVPAPPPLSWATSHSALPVVRPVGDALRLYFSTRDARGRSHIAAGWLDLKTRAVKFDDQIALGLGPLGAFDDNGVTSSCIVQHDGRTYQYYTGWNIGVTVPFYLAVGCAVCTDGGQSFARVSPAPVLGRSSVDPFLVASPSVLVEDGVWRMWYVSGTEWRLEAGTPRHRYHVKYAESDDGIEWRPTGRVCIDYRDASETSIARPCVIKDGALYRMWYCSRGDAYQIGYAESLDGLTWMRKDEEVGISPSPEGWDSEMQAYPFVFDYDGQRHMLYNGNGFGATGIGHAVFE
jgi:hypothetical protein